MPAPQAGPMAGIRARRDANWDDEDELPRPLTAAEALRYRDQRTAPSPWRVVLVQAQAGAIIALLFGLASGWPALWASLFGAATAVVPGALMARAAMRNVDSRSPMATLMQLLVWESMKIVSSAVMLVIGFRTLHFAALPLLGTLGACLAVYGAALAWRSR